MEYATNVERYRQDCRNAKKLLQNDPDVTNVEEIDRELVATVQYPEDMRTVGQQYTYKAYYSLDGCLLRRGGLIGPKWKEWLKSD